MVVLINCNLVFWLNKYHMLIMRLFSLLLKVWYKSYSLLNAIHYSPLKIAFTLMPLSQNLCFYWQVFSANQQTINMTPLNAHILTPKINRVLFSSSRHTAPTRTVYRSCSLTSRALRSQSDNTPPCIYTNTHFGTPRDNRVEQSSKGPWERSTAGSLHGSE